MFYTIINNGYRCPSQIFRFKTKLSLVLLQKIVTNMFIKKVLKDFDQGTALKMKCYLKSIVTYARLT